MPAQVLARQQESTSGFDRTKTPRPLLGRHQALGLQQRERPPHRRTSRRVLARKLVLRQQPHSRAQAPENRRAEFVDDVFAGGWPAPATRSSNVAMAPASDGPGMLTDHRFSPPTRSDH